MDCIEDSNTASELERQLNLYLSALQSRRDPEGFDFCWEQATAIMEKLHNLQFPWNPAETKLQKVARGWQAWKDQYGDPASPETKEAIERTIKFLRQRLEGGKGGKDGRLTRSGKLAGKEAAGRKARRRTPETRKFGLMG